MPLQGPSSFRQGYARLVANDEAPFQAVESIVGLSSLRKSQGGATESSRGLKRSLITPS